MTLSNVKALFVQPTSWIIFLATLPAFVIIIRHLGDPMWYEEVWRAHAISDFTLQRYDAEAPIGLGYFLLTKLLTFFTNVEVVQRFLTYIFALLVPLALYRLGRTIASQQFAYMLTLIGSCSPLFLSFVATNKPYAGDILFTLLFITAFLQYQKGQISYKKLFLAGAVGVCFSMALAYFVLLAMVYKALCNWRQHVHLLKGLAPLIVIVVLALVLFVGFLRPQTPPDLTQYWFGEQRAAMSVELKQNAKSFVGMFSGHVVLQDAIFGLAEGAITPLPDISGFSYNLWLNRLAIVAAMVLFAFGFVKMLRKPDMQYIPFAVTGVLAGTFILDLARIWPFGSNRVNIFLMMIMLSIVVYGFYELCRVVFASKNTRVLVNALFTALLVTLSLLTIQNHQEVAYKDLLVNGMRDTTRLVQSGSKQGDTVLIYHPLSRPSFLYYYEEYTGHKLDTKNVASKYYFDITDKSLADVPIAAREKGIEGDIWAIWPIAYGHDPTEKMGPEYKVVQTSRYKDVEMVHLKHID